MKDGTLDLADVQSMNFTPAEQSVFALRPGDVLVSEGSGSLNSVGASAVWRGELDEMVCFQNTLLRLRPRAGVDGRYLEWWARSAFGSGVFASIASGANIYHLSAERVRALPISLPSLKEQRQVADFLDAETARIDVLAQLARQGRKLLDERRWATVHAAVTGLGVSGPKKDCGLGWTESLPKNWPVAPLKWVASLGSGHTPSRTKPDYWENCTIPWISLFDVGRMRDARQEQLNETTQKISKVGMENSSACLHSAGTVVLSRTASVGFSTVMGRDMAVSQHFATWTCGEFLLPHYLLHTLRAMRQYFESVQVGTTNVTVFMPDLNSIKIPLPTLVEQEEIVNHIRTVTSRIDDLAERFDRQMKLLAERRQALITAAVTGQIDVSTASGRGIEE